MPTAPRTARPLCTQARCGALTAARRRPAPPSTPSPLQLLRRSSTAAQAKGRTRKATKDAKDAKDAEEDAGCQLSVLAEAAEAASDEDVCSAAETLEEARAAAKVRRPLPPRALLFFRRPADRHAGRARPPSFFCASAR